MMYFENFIQVEFKASQKGHSKTLAWICAPRIPITRFLKERIDIR